jgi:5-formyltetrahydrofolate cyclo-ligase
MLQRRMSLPPEQRRRLSEAACGHLALDRAFRSAGTVLLYWSLRGEVETAALALAAREAGKRLALPRVQHRPRALLLHEWSGIPADLVEGAYGISEPRADWPVIDPSQIDLVVVPGVAFDRRGARLGYGGGYYDRTLPLVRERNPATLAVGLCYSFQVLELLPSEPHDQLVDALCTEEGMLLTGGTGP